MAFDYAKLQHAEDPFFGIVPGKASYQVGRVTLPVTFGTPDNYRTEHIHFEVADFKSSYRAIFGRPMLARFMAIPNHTYRVMKMPTPRGVLSIRGDIKTSFECDGKAIRLVELSRQIGNSALMVEEAAANPPEDLMIPEQTPTPMALEPASAPKEVSLDLADPSKKVLIGANLDRK
ncbi:unnamed protein product [Urochloa humidicola]